MYVTVSEKRCFISIWNKLVLIEVYRTETDYIEEFDCYKFTENLYSQMTEMLKNSISVPTLNVLMEVR